MGNGYLLACHEKMTLLHAIGKPYNMQCHEKRACHGQRALHIAEKKGVIVLMEKVIVKSP